MPTRRAELVSATVSQLRASLDAVVERHRREGESHETALARLRASQPPDFPDFWLLQTHLILRDGARRDAARPGQS